MKKALFAFILLPIFSYADALSDNFKLSVGAFIVGDNKTLFSLNDHSGESISLDLQKRLKMQLLQLLMAITVLTNTTVLSLVMVKLEVNQLNTTESL